MAVHLGVVRAGERTAGEMVARSRGALDGSLTYPGELWVAVARDEALLLGAFQRGSGMPDRWPLLQRGSGGPEVLVGPGTVHVALSLAHPGALFGGDERRIVNRAVRPLLRALTKVGALAHYFGRDWVSVAHRPAAWVGFAHDASTRRALFEAFVAVRAPFAIAERPSFLGKPQGTLESLGGRALDSARVADAIVEAYVRGAEAQSMPAPALPPGSFVEDRDLRADPPWAAVGQEAIGTVGAGPDAGGVFRVGGDLLASRDALARLELGCATAAEHDLARIVDETLAAPGVALDGVRSLESVRAVISAALRLRSKAGA